MLKGQRGYVLPLAIGIAFFTMIVVLIIFSAVKANWWAYWDMRMRFESQLMAEDIIAVVSAEESYEWADGDSDYSYLLDVWEDSNMTKVMKYGGGGSYDFLAYYPGPDAYPTGFQPRPITGAFYLSSDAVDDINHEITLIALVSGRGMSEDELFSTLQDAALWGDVGTDTEQYANRRAYYSFSLGIKYLENVSMAEYNSLDFGKFARIGGEAYFRSTYGVFGLYPLSTVDYDWAVYDENGNLHAIADTSSTYPDRLFDSVFLGKLHVYDDRLRFWQLNTSTKAELYVLNSDLYDSMDTSHEAAAVSIRVKVCDADNTAPCEDWARNSGLPWYKWCWQEKDGKCLSYQYRLVHPSLLTPSGASVEEGLANKVFPFGYSLGDTSVLDQLFNRSWDEIVRTDYNSPVARAQRDGNYLNLRWLADGTSVVATLYTVCADASCSEIHTMLAVVHGACYRRDGCSVSSPYAQVYVYDLQEESSSGDTLLIDFGDLSRVYLTPPCVMRAGTTSDPRPFWNGLPRAGGGSFSLCYYANYFGRRVFYVSDDGAFTYSDCHINPRACDESYNPNTIYPWVHRVFMTQDDLDYITNASHWDTYSVWPEVWHTNWQNVIQYNMNITIVAGGVAVAGDVVPVPTGDPSNPPAIYEYDLAEDESHMQMGMDLPNMADYPKGEVLGLLVSGRAGWVRDERVKKCFLTWYGWKCYLTYHSVSNISLWFMDYTGPEDKFPSSSAMYGFRFLPDPDNLLPGNSENKEWQPGQSGQVAWAHDMLMYSHFFSHQGGFGYYPPGDFVWTYYYTGNTLISADVPSLLDVYPPFSEVFKKVGMFADYEEGSGMLAHIGGNCYGFCRDRYYLAPKNPVKSRPYYWIMPDPDHMPDIYITDLRMHK